MNSMGSWRPTRPTVRRVVLGLALLLVVGVGVPLGWGWYVDQRDRCTDGVVRKGPLNECVGVADGSDPDFTFDEPSLARVQKLIAKENAMVVKEGKSYATIAYLSSFTVEQDDSNSAESVRRELQGAYLAQHRANRGDQPGSPKIRLVVANAGSGFGQWEHTVDRLIEMSQRDSDDRLVAVAGLGPSLKSSKRMLKKLAKHEIAMVGSIMTAVHLADVPGLVRVPPTNRGQAEAAADFLKREGYRTSVIVQDEATDNPYATSLAEEFRRSFPDDEHRLIGEPLLYDASQPDHWENQLYFSTRTLCYRTPDVVYFAGRGKHLMTFVKSLANRTCQDREFTVMTGDDTTNLTAEELSEAAKKGVDLFYTGIAHPRMWEEDPHSVSKASADFFREGGWMDRKFPNDPRDDGQAIVGHDATLTAIHAVRMAAYRGSRLTGAAVAGMLTQMHGDQRVEGASGFLSFRNNGNPIDKALPIMRLDRTGHFRLTDVRRAED